MDKYQEITVKSDKKTIQDWLAANIGGFLYSDEGTRIDLHRSVTNQGDIEVDATLMLPPDESGVRQIHRLGRCFEIKLIEEEKRLTKLRIGFIQDEPYLSYLSSLITTLEDKFQLEKEKESKKQQIETKQPYSKRDKRLIELWNDGYTSEQCAEFLASEGFKRLAPRTILNIISRLRKDDPTIQYHK
jgi:hypothetical protein